MPARSKRFDVRPVLASGMLLGVGTVLTFASFTDTETAATVFSTGTVDLELEYGKTLGTWTTLEMKNAKPGDVSYAPLVVSNVGSLDFTYGMATTALGDDNLAAAMKVTIVSGATGCDADGFPSGTPVLGESPLGTAVLSNRALAAAPDAATKETLCFKVELPSDTDDALQHKKANVYFLFTATQAA